LGTPSYNLCREVILYDELLLIKSISSIRPLCKAGVLPLGGYET